ncbi:sugar ABC transporter substrate-binding protein [Chloroflexi bacterium TSY]|nr:sugar ABC transporter substrate-binding protein [Chloroflexi bacterium TSY]
MILSPTSFSCENTSAQSFSDQYLKEEEEVPIFEDVIAKFEAEHPNIKIDYLNFTGNIEDMVKTQGVGGNLPDVWYARTYVTADYASKGWTLNLSDLIERDDVDVDDFWPAQTAQDSWQGDLYSLPYDFSNVGVAYNKTMFDEMGIPYPTNDWTLEEMAEIAEQFVQKDEDGKITRWGLNIFPWGWPWLGILQSNGGQVFNEDQSKCIINSPENLATIEFFQGMRERGIFPESGATPEGIEPFSNGLIAMTFMGSWATQWRRDLIGDQFEWDVVKFPYGSTGHRGITPAGGAWAIASTSEHIEESWTWIKFLTSTESTNTLISDHTRSIPGRKSSVPRWTEVASSGELDPKSVHVFAEMMDEAYELTYPAYWNDYQTAWSNLMVPAITGGDGVMGPAEALEEFKKQCNEAIANSSG